MKRRLENIRNQENTLSVNKKKKSGSTKSRPYPGSMDFKLKSGDNTQDATKLRKSSSLNDLRNAHGLNTSKSKSNDVASDSRPYPGSQELSSQIEASVSTATPIGIESSKFQVCTVPHQYHLRSRTSDLVSGNPEIKYQKLKDVPLSINKSIEENYDKSKWKVIDDFLEIYKDKKGFVSEFRNRYPEVFKQVDQAEQNEKTITAKAFLSQKIEHAIEGMFACEDEALQYARRQAEQMGKPNGCISARQGKLFQMLATICKAKKILEIGTLTGYSGIWLARALPSDGKLITLEIDHDRANAAHQSFLQAGLANRTEIRIGNALELLPNMDSKQPFDLILIDANFDSYPCYLNSALRLTRPGSIIIADNSIWHGHGLKLDDAMNQGRATEKDAAALVEYNQKAAKDLHLDSIAVPFLDQYNDGFTVSVVKESVENSAD